MTDAWAADTLIKATVRAGHIMTHFLQFKPREDHLLSCYASLLGCWNKQGGDQKNRRLIPVEGL